jgi:diadenosine tetraphosphate (Ap4A) HIT family hydrolase
MNKTLNHFCEFCDILKNKKHLILYENDFIFAFNDISKASAVEHILVCPK